jgi:hypothetical protein
MQSSEKKEKIQKGSHHIQIKSREQESRSLAKISTSYNEKVI